MTQVVRAHSPADFLASLPAIAGYTVHDSLLCVAFSGNRTCGVFRFDLPRKRTADYRRLASLVVSTLARMPDADGIAPVIYTDETFEAARGIPWLDFGREVIARVTDQGFRINEVFCVAADGWASYLDRDYPRAGRPLSDITANELGEFAMVVRGDDVHDIRHAAQLEPAGPVTTAAMLYALEDPPSLFEAAAAEASPDVVEWVEHCLDRDRWTITQLAWFLELAQSPSDRDVMMLQIAFGRAVGEEELEKNERYLAIKRRTGLSMDEIVRAEIEANGLPEEDLLLGHGSERPVIDRVERGIALVSKAVVAAPDFYRPAPLCMLGWLSWSLGRGSAAGSFIDMALEIDPEYGMAQLLFTVFGTGHLPDWAFAPATSDSDDN